MLRLSALGTHSLTIEPKRTSIERSKKMYPIYYRYHRCRSRQLLGDAKDILPKFP